MIRVLTVEETTVLNLINGEFCKSSRVLGDPCNSVSFNKGKSPFYIKSTICIFLTQIDNTKVVSFCLLSNQ